MADGDCGLDLDIVPDPGALLVSPPVIAPMMAALRMFVLDRHAAGAVLARDMRLVLVAVGEEDPRVFQPRALGQRDSWSKHTMVPKSSRKIAATSSYRRSPRLAAFLRS